MDTSSTSFSRTAIGASFAGPVALRDVSLVLGGRTVVGPLNAAFEAGKVSCILGPSGCGKTSLLRLIAGIAEPATGSISINGVHMAGGDRFIPPERRNVGFVFQDFALFPHMTALENVAYGLYALKRADAREVARRGLERVGLGALADRFPAALSGGEQQRVALARAIVPRPQVLLMDEPFSGLDQRLREQVRGDALTLVKEALTTAILVTHDPREALDVADRIFLMGKGHILQHGTPREIYDRPESVHAARMFSSYNALSGRVSGKVVGTAVGQFSCDAGDHADVDVLIKPEAIGRSGGNEGFAALIKDIRFLGESQRLTLLVDGLEQPLSVTRPVQENFSAGENARFTIDHNGVFVFTTDHGATT